MCLFVILNIILLSWCYQPGGAEIELSPKTVYELLSLRIDNVILQTHNLKSEFTETKASVERIEKKMERIDANMLLMESKADKSEREKSLSLVADSVKVIQESSKQFIQEKFKTETILLRKMLVKEKSHLRRRVLTFEKKFKKLQSEVVKHLTLMNNSMESEADKVEHSMIEHKIVVDNRLSLAEKEIQHSFNETDMIIQEMTANFENKLTDSDAKIKQIEVAFTGNVSKISQRLSTINSDLESMTSGFNGRLDNTESQLRTMSSKIGKAEILIPENGYLLGKKRNVLSNGETYRICCTNGFEVESDSIFPYDKKTCETIRNNDGILEPKIQCSEERCDPSNLLNGYAEYDNSSRILSKLPSGLSVFLFCEDGFKFYDNDGQPLHTKPKRQCRKGVIINAPICIEAKCSLADQPSNQFTRYKDPDTTAQVSADVFIDSRQKIEVFCDNQYELYVNDSKQYMDTQFITRCRKGKFNNYKFPVCVEKRCSFNASEACFFEDDDRKCKRDDFKIQSRSSINIKCDTGYHLSLSGKGVEEQGSLNCNKGSYPSLKCIQSKCIVPHDFDSLISITNKDFINIPGGSVVEVGENVYFNCSKASELIYEPTNRRFKCVNGLWIEDERDKSWKFGNNGTFPKCRKAMCDQKCHNGGVCSRDNYCRCKYLTRGKLCERVICDKKCISNGGKCIGPGKCECPLEKFGNNCQHVGCRLPELKNMAQIQSTRVVFPPGEKIHNFQCNPSYFLSSNNEMTCQNDGSWSDDVECVKGVFYLISVKTGSMRFAGTGANVYITLVGAGGSTRRIDLKGSFERNEFRNMAKDIRPIKKVQIGHDGSGVGPGLYIDYVSIYVENMEEFYSFRNKDHRWVRMDNDLTLNKSGSDDCIDSFGKELKWYPKWNDTNFLFLGLRSLGGLRACKQACINYENNYCRGVYYTRVVEACHGFSTIKERYFRTSDKGWRGSVYFRKCKDDV